MERNLVTIVLVSVALLLIASCAKEPVPQKPEQNNLEHIYVTISAQNGIVPKDITMKKGVVLDVYNYESAVVLESQSGNKDIPTKEMTSFEITTQGEHKFSCNTCSGNKELIVKII